MTPDCTPDGVFDATIVGPILRLALVTTDELGGPSSGQAYDTIIGDEPMPTSIPTWFERGSDTWVLGVVRAGELLNRADGSVPELEGGHALDRAAPHEHRSVRIGAVLASSRTDRWLQSELE